MKTPLIPHEIWTRLVAFLADGTTGTVTLHVHQGVVVEGEFTDKVRQRRPQLTERRSTV